MWCTVYVCVCVCVCVCKRERERERGRESREWEISLFPILPSCSVVEDMFNILVCLLSQAVSDTEHRYITFWCRKGRGRGVDQWVMLLWSSEESPCSMMQWCGINAPTPMGIILFQLFHHAHFSYENMKETTVRRCTHKNERTHCLFQYQKHLSYATGV